MNTSSQTDVVHGFVPRDVPRGDGWRCTPYYVGAYHVTLPDHALDHDEPRTTDHVFDPDQAKDCEPTVDPGWLQDFEAERQAIIESNGHDVPF